MWTVPDPLRVGTYTASDNALRGRGSGYARLGGDEGGERFLREWWKTDEWM